MDDKNKNFPSSFLYRNKYLHKLTISHVTSLGGIPTTLDRNQLV